MDIGMKEKMKNGRLTDQDVRKLIDWQLTLESEKIDSQLLDECLLYLYPEDCALSKEQKETLWSRIRSAAFGASRVRRHRAQHRRRYSVRAVLIALMITLMLAGVAIAATLGLFGHFTSDPMIEMSHQRLEYLDEVAVNVGETIQVVAPAGDMSSIDLTTDYGKIVAQQFARHFELTVDQVYCDGNKLYYSYQLIERQRTFELLEGTPTGFESWDWEEPGLRLSDTYWTPGATEEETSRAQEWFETHERAYSIETYFGLGDGADLDDGSEKGVSLNIYDSSQQNLDPYTIQGFQQVDLPEDYVPGDTIDFLLTVMYHTNVIYQNENGVYRTSVWNPENRGFVRVPVTAKITGKPEEYAVTATFDEYTAEVQLAISDVDISGTVLFDAPQAWIDAFDSNSMSADCVYDFVLVADGQEMPNVGLGWGVDRKTGRWNVDIRYDLPLSAQSLTLVPRRELSGMMPEESITIR